MDDTLSDDGALMMAYGLYLLNGGRKEDFMDLSPYDVQIMTHTYMGLEARRLKMFLDLFKSG